MDLKTTWWIWDTKKNTLFNKTVGFKEKQKSALELNKRAFFVKFFRTLLMRYPKEKQFSNVILAGTSSKSKQKI